jgi:hypothetical protein
MTDAIQLHTLPPSHMISGRQDASKSISHLITTTTTTTNTKQALAFW